MAGILSTATDLDAIFEPRGATTAASNTGILIGGTDISDTYMELGTNGTTAAAVTGILSGASDLNAIFGAIGTAQNQVTLNATYSAAHIQISPSDATASLSFDNAGDITRAGTGAGDVGDWVSDKTGLTGSEFEILVTKNSGITPSGLIGSYQDLSVQRTWGLTETGTGTQTCELAVTIREIADVANIDTTTVTITATVDP